MATSVTGRRRSSQRRDTFFILCRRDPALPLQSNLLPVLPVRRVRCDMTSARRKTRSVVPLPPLLSAVRTGEPHPIALVESAAYRRNLRLLQADWFNADYLDTAPATALGSRVREFLSDFVPGFTHPDSIEQSPGLLRHALIHFLRGEDECWSRFARCAVPGGSYFIPGLGRRFWGVLFPALGPDTLPCWLPEVEAGMRRTGVVDERIPQGSTVALEHACRAYSSLMAEYSGLTASELDSVFLGVADMVGRELVQI